MRSKRNVRLAVLVTAILVMILLLAAVSPALAFPDVPSGYAYEKAIDDLSSAGIISGYTNGDFGPNDPVKRAQFAKMILGALGIAPGSVTATRFTDLGSPDGNGYPQRYVQAAYDNGITFGTNAAQTLFDPWASIRRDQVVSMIVRAAKSLYPASLADPPSGGASLFDAISEPHGQNLRIAEYNGLLNGLVGMGTGWSVTAPAGRGEVAQMLWNLLAKLHESHPPTDVTVQADGSGDYPTLEAALAHVPVGAAIHLGPGVFDLTGTLTIRSNCELSGTGLAAEGTTVRYAGAVVDVQGADVTLTGIRFESTTNSADSNVMSAMNANLILDDCYFTGGNKVTTGDGYGDGLRIELNSSATVTNCVFTSNEGNGIVVGGMTKAVLENNQCSANGSCGIVLWGASVDAASRNACTGNGYCGILVNGYAIVTLDRNTCSSNTLHGMGLEGASQVTATYNTCASNGQNGIYCWSAARVKLDHNVCQHNGRSGVALTAESVSEVRYNDCSYNDRDGIEVWLGAVAIVENNTCLHNTDSGIWFRDTTNGSVSGNECAFGNYGIRVTSPAFPLIRINNLHDNTFDLSLPGSP